jgi:hypothetical protein
MREEILNLKAKMRILYDITGGDPKEFQKNFRTMFSELAPQ